MHSLINDYEAGCSAPMNPCLSLSQPTHRAYPENQQDPTRFKNLLKSLSSRCVRSIYLVTPMTPAGFRGIAQLWVHRLALIQPPWFTDQLRLREPQRHSLTLENRKVYLQQNLF